MAEHIWYSPATDITGQALAQGVGLAGTKEKPANLAAGDVVIGWGAKTKKNVSFPAGVHALNHPNNIKENRNKLAALVKMAANADLTPSIAKYCEAGAVLAELGKKNSTLTLPLIGRTKYHQGGKGFWLCLTKRQVEKALGHEKGPAYFQNYVDIATEYRLHVAFGKVIYAAKKKENATDEGWIAQRKEKIQDYNNKNGWNLNDASIDHILGVLVKEVTLPDRIIRSNRLGWKFSKVRLNNISAGLKAIAIKSVEVLGLDFGAVDCAIGADNKPYIIEVNSGPGLQGTALERYTTAFRDRIKEIKNPKKQKVAKVIEAVKNAASAKDKPPIKDLKGMRKGGLAMVMRSVKNENEAEAVIQALMAEREG